MKKHALYAIICAIAVLVAGYIGYQRFTTPLVSVVMLTYKRADILSRAIDSILAQTNGDFEFIILNDGSPDNTKDVVKQYDDKRIRYFENDKNRGIAYSRNRAASLARGKYIMIMDDDDISLPERLEKQADYMEKHPDVDVLVGQLVGWPLVPDSHNDIAVGLIQYNNVGNANVMYRRLTAEKNNIRYKENIEFGEDWYFWLQMLFAKAKFWSIPDKVVIRNTGSEKHYKADVGDLNEQVKAYVGRFFSPASPEAFYKADACGKLYLIWQKRILSEDYISNLLEANNCR